MALALAVALRLRVLVDGVRPSESARPEMAAEWLGLSLPPEVMATAEEIADAGGDQALPRRMLELLPKTALDLDRAQL